MERINSPYEKLLDMYIVENGLEAVVKSFLPAWEE